MIPDFRHDLPLLHAGGNGARHGTITRGRDGRPSVPGSSCDGRSSDLHTSSRSRAGIMAVHEGRLRARPAGVWRLSLADSASLFVCLCLRLPVCLWWHCYLRGNSASLLDLLFYF